MSAPSPQPTRSQTAAVMGLGHSLVDFPCGAPVDDLGFETLFFGFLLDTSFELVAFSNETDVLPMD